MCDVWCVVFALWKLWKYKLATLISLPHTTHFLRLCSPRRTIFHTLATHTYMNVSWIYEYMTRLAKPASSLRATCLNLCWCFSSSTRSVCLYMCICVSESLAFFVCIFSPVFVLCSWGIVAIVSSSAFGEEVECALRWGCRVWEAFTGKIYDVAATSKLCRYTK